MTFQEISNTYSWQSRVNVTVNPSGRSVLTTTIIIIDEVILYNGEDDDVEVRGTLSVGTSPF
jgi:hypothetical protein